MESMIQDQVQKLVLAALARHGAMGVEMIASFAEATPDEVKAALKDLQVAGRVEKVAGKRTARFQVKATTPAP